MLAALAGEGTVIARRIGSLLGWIVGGVLGCLHTGDAAAQIEGCALALGRTPQNTLAFQVVAGMTDEQTALNHAAAPFQQPGYHYLNGGMATNGGVAAVIYRLPGSGEHHQRFSADTTALGAIFRVLDAIGGLYDRQQAPYVKWVRCHNSEPLAREQLAQLTWSTNLTRQYTGYQAQVREFSGYYGDFYMMAASGSTAPPSPTPAPSGATTPVGCWQRFDAHGRADGNIVSILPERRNDGSTAFEGRHVLLSPAQVSANRRLGGVGLKIWPAPTGGARGNYTGWYEYTNGNQRQDYFMVTADTISIDTTPASVERFTWRRVACPR